MGKGIFIVLDGIDGSGKSELTKMVHNYLFSKSKKNGILTTREPTNGVSGKKIREILMKEKDTIKSGKKLLDLFVQDREYHLKTIIEPFLKESEGDGVNIVVCDRYYYSNIAFQGAQGFDMNEIIEKNRNFRKPDMAFIMDLDPEIALSRIESRAKEKFEQVDFMRKVRNNFLELPKLLDDNLKVIDASRPMEDVFSDIKKELDGLV